MPRWAGRGPCGAGPVADLVGLGGPARGGRELTAGLGGGEAEEARRAAEADMFSDISLDAPVSLEEGETPTSLDDIQF